MTKGSIEEKQVIADYGNLAEEFWWELYIYFKIQELMKRRIAPSNKPDSRLENDPLKELAEMEKWFLMVGTAFRDNDSKFFKTLAKIAKFLSKGESNDLLAKRVLAAYAQCKSAGLKSISSSNLIKVLDELSPLRTTGFTTMEKSGE